MNLKHKMKDEVEAIAGAAAAAGSFTIISLIHGWCAWSSGDQESLCHPLLTWC